MAVLHIGRMAGDRDVLEQGALWPPKAALDAEWWQGKIPLHAEGIGGRGHPRLTLNQFGAGTK